MKFKVGDKVRGISDIYNIFRPEAIVPIEIKTQVGEN